MHHSIRTLACILFAANALALPAIAQEPTADQARLVDAQAIAWVLGDQVWDFSPIATTYEPMKGEFDPVTGEAIWTLALITDLTPGEAGLHTQSRGSPFKPVLLTEDKVVVAADARVRITQVTGKLGDAIRVTVQLPADDLLGRTKLIRLDRRTEVGF
jgi:hypothetical protein